MPIVKIIKEYKKKYFIVILISLFISGATIGSTAFGQDLIFLGSIGEMYDDNTNASSNNQKSDYITNLMIGLGINLEGRTQTLQFLGHVYQQLYYSQTNLNNNSQDLILNYNKQFTSRDTFSLNDIFNHYPEPRDFQYMFGQPVGRNSYYTNNLNLAFDKDIISDFSINLHYNNVITKNSNEALSDSMQNGAGLRLDYSINAFNIISLLYDYKIIKYETIENLNGNEQDQIIQHNAGLGYQHFFTRQLRLSSNGGIEYIKSQDVENYNPFFSLSVIDDIDQNNTINVTVSKRYQISLLTNDIYNSWTFSTIFTRQITARLTFSFTVFYEYGKTVSTLTENEIMLLGISTFINYYLNEHIFINTRYMYTKNETKQAEPVSFKAEYDRNQIQLSANAEY